MKSKVLVFSLVILTAILLLTLKPIYAQSLKVIPVPMVSTNPIIPHDTYNGVATTFKAIARGGTGTYNYEWDFNGDGTYDYSDSTSDPYNLSASHTYPDQASDRTFIAKIRVTSGAETATAEYRVTIHSTAFLWVKVNKAIDDGLWYLHTHQTRGIDANSADYGYWDYYYPVAATGATIEAFELQGHLAEGDYDVDPYVETVQRGLNFILGHTYAVSIFPQTAGDPDTNGNGIGLACDSSMGGEYIYENGISFTALATSNAPNRIAQTGPANVIGRAYKDIVQDMIDYMAFAQNEPESGPFRGGWRYNANSGESDNSNSQWPVIAMVAAETNMGPLAIPPVVPPVVVPQFVKDELSIWIDYIQNDVSGGSGYMDPFNWVNIAKTGGLLCEMAFYGDTAATTRAAAAINYIDANWDTDPEHFPYNSYYAFYSVMKGFRLLKIDTLPSGLDWYADPARGYAPHLVNTQYADGSWVDGYYVGASYLADAWAIAILQPHPTVIMPTAVAKANPKEAPPGAVITFDHSGSYHPDPDRKLVAFRWDFDNDGEWDYETPDINAKPTWVYNDDIGCGEEVIHPVTLEVEDDAGNTDQDTESVVIKINLFNHPPVAIGDPTPSDPNYEVSQGGKVLLDASASYDPDTGAPIKCDPNAPDDHIVKWEWDLNNDGVYDVEGETYLFDTPDGWEIGSTHTVQLRVCDDGTWAGPDGGGSRCDETTVTIFVSEAVTVNVDIKPSSCPNPLNLKSKGVLPIAILGTEELDVTTIDPATVKLNRESVECSVSPLRWSYEDVATPFEGELCDCHDLNGDGYMDLTLKFDTQEVVSCLELIDVAGETIPLIVTGNLKEEHGGTPIRGEDCMRFMFKCSLIPDATVIPRGGTLGFQATVTNYTSGKERVLFATDVTMPNGNKSGYLISPIGIVLTPNGLKSNHVSHNIPDYAPLGIYTYHGYVGKNAVDIYHECTFEFEVTQ